MEGQSKESFIVMEGSENKGREVHEVVAMSSALEGTCNLLLRLSALILTLVAAVVIGADKQTTVVPVKFLDSLPPLDVPVIAKWHYLSAYEIANKNAENRHKQQILHTLGSTTLARKRDEMELQDRRPYSRGDMYEIAHKKKDGGFVNDEAREKYLIGCDSHSTASTSSSDANAKMTKMQIEIDTLKAQVTEVDALKEQVAELDVVKEQHAFLMQIAKGNQSADLESPNEARHSSNSSHTLGNHQGTSSHGAI